MCIRSIDLLLVVGVLLPGVVRDAAAAELVPYTKRWDVKLESLPPEAILSKLDLSGPGLEAAKTAAEQGKRTEVLAALLAHYRAKYPLPPRPQPDPKRQFTEADGVVNHVLQWGPYEPADYGDTIDWQWDPRGDIEWVAAVYRFYWATPLVEAFAATRDEKYARAFVELTADWITKHPLEQRDITHPVYKNWRGFPWLDIQTGIRAAYICRAFKTLVHGKAFTPEFLGTLLASLYDHQVKTERIPMGKIHNKAVFEQRGFVNVAVTFREFKDAKRWMALAVERAGDNLLAQTTIDGVQREWSAGYHRGVLRDAEEIAAHAGVLGVTVPDAYRDRVRRMHDYIFAIATPDLGFPMFGDCSRSPQKSDDRSRWPLYGTLVQASKSIGDPKYVARARLDRSALPEQRSYAFEDAGMYVMRSGWGPEQIYLALHCSPPAISSHDQPDNGTFELYAYGRWLMTDTGYYTYGHDPEARKWHRQTRAHQTLTLDGADTSVKPKQHLWQRSRAGVVLVVENQSYKALLHRRTVWFVDRKFFVLLDEAIGKANGTLRLHLQLAAGDAVVDTANRRAKTRFDDANVLVWSAPTIPVSLETEEGWFAWKYGYRKPRTAFSFRHQRTAPAAFLTLLVPYRGLDAPEVSAALPDDYAVGAQAVSLRVECRGRAWQVGRDLTTGKAWCRPE